MAFRKPGIPAVNTPDRTLNQAVANNPILKQLQEQQAQQAQAL